jgi:hypothetical protein
VAQRHRRGKLLLRLALGLILLVWGVVMIYGFSAGYFSLFGLRLGRPWNLVGAIILLIALLATVWKIVVGPRFHRTRRTG